MLILLFFAFLAGIVTVFSPCVLPLLPAILAGGVSKDTTQYSKRPLGIILGFICSFTFFTLALNALVQLLGISPDILRYIAIAVIAIFGLVMLFPTLGDLFARLTSPFAKIGSQIEGQASSTQGFGSGFLLGVALGFVWTPCAGPILAAITTLVALHKISWLTVFVLLFYSVGAALPLFAIAYGGSWAIQSSRFLSYYAEQIRQLFGAIMILTALALTFNIDVILQQFAIEHLPPIPVENNALVQKGLQNLRSDVHFYFVEDANTLPNIEKAPEFVGISHWLNSPPLTLADLKGKVVLVDFWTYSCINCVRTLPDLKRWYDLYKDKGFVIVGVHTPEFAFEKKTKNVEDAIQRFGLTYPIAQDNDYQTWQAYHNAYWPADYLIDQNGVIRLIHYGEGHALEIENGIRRLLNEKPLEKPAESMPIHRSITPETYLGTARGASYSTDISLETDKVKNYSYKSTLESNEVGLKGSWLATAERITAEENGAILELNFIANQVYLVMSDETNQEQVVNVLLDDKPIDKNFYTKDMNANGQILVKEPRMYHIVDLANTDGRHKLTLIFPKGVSSYAFTFG